jgi:hypothetical protein
MTELSNKLNTDNISELSIKILTKYAIYLNGKKFALFIIVSK